ncbi:hypothetical protein [Bacillus sp. 03113]|uniref:hypothetical protein n=1 Tax=Bacillus sp. 03113 TaxID=2578211 RepID=UPI001144E39C|nr:hypothetical protein [Bacillus sp. 03113]
MILTMKRQEFDALTHEALFNACFNPLILVYKNRMVEQKEENTSMVKEQFYKQLTKGQQALFAFQVYYTHVSHSLAEFYWWSTYFRAQPKTWLAIISGLQYFGDKGMLLLLEEIDEVLERHNHPSSLEGFSVTREDLDRNQELFASISPLHINFDKAAPLTIKIISEHIRNSQKEFVKIED